MFKEEVCAAIGNYVYRLIDPRNGETFYVGKGMGNRVFEHALAAIPRLGQEEDEVSLKLARIRRIRETGLEVIHVLHRHGIPDAAVFEVEAALIDAFPGLENIQGGHGSAARGPMHANEITMKYGLAETQQLAGQQLLLINVNRSSDSPEAPSVYESVRYAWRLDVGRARQMTYVLAVRRGVVLDAFVATEWKRALAADFPGLGVDLPTRWGFDGQPAPDDIRRHYARTRLPSHVTHVQFPVRYWLNDALAEEERA